MSFQIVGLDGEKFAPLFACSDHELEAMGARRQVVTENPGTPCRVSLEDAPIGETVILCHYEHQSADSPFRASHAIYVRENAQRATPSVGEIPRVFLTRMMSIRAFDADHMMVDACVLPGEHIGGQIEEMLQRADIEYIHLHYAAPGCFAASVVRA